MYININKLKSILWGLLSIIIVALTFSCSSIDYIGSKTKLSSAELFQKKQFSLTTYNIKAIYDKEKDQMDNLMEYVQKGEFDFVIFQELFDESMRDYIIENTDTNYYTSIISRVDYNSFPEFIFQDAGLFLMSRYPLVDLSGIDFGDGIKNSSGVIHMILDKEISKTNDFLSNKSVMGALFETNENTRLLLFTTHVQAIGTQDHKQVQLRQIKKFIDTALDNILKSDIVSSSEDLIVLLAGDFNSDAYDEERSEIMQNILGYPRDLHLEFNGNKEEYTFRFNSNRNPRRFDYILAYDRIGSNEFKKVKVLSSGVFDVKDDEGNSISDHTALRAVMDFE